MRTGGLNADKDTHRARSTPSLKSHIMGNIVVDLEIYNLVHAWNTSEHNIGNPVRAVLR